jgi:hypothetical protein
MRLLRWSYKSKNNSGDGHACRVVQHRVHPSTAVFVFEPYGGELSDRHSHFEAHMRFDDIVAALKVMDDHRAGPLLAFAETLPEKPLEDLRQELGLAA